MKICKIVRFTIASSVSVTSVEVIHVRIGRWNQGLPQLSNQIED